METMTLVETTVYDGSTDTALMLSGAGDATYRMTVLPYDEDAPATVSIWVKAAAATGVLFVALGETFVHEVGTSWQRLEMAVEEPEGQEVLVSIVGDGAVMIYKCMVETANKPSDWSPAPEDHEEIMDGLSGDVGELRTQAEDTLATVQRMLQNGANLIDSSESLTITGNGTDTQSRALLAHGLKGAANYTLSMEAAEKTAGTAAGMTLEGVRVSDGAILFSRTLDFSLGYQKTTFTTAEDGEYDLYIYAGIKGSTSGVAVKLTRVKLVEGTFAALWSESKADAERRIAGLVSQLEATRTGFESRVTGVANDVAGIAEKTSFLRFDGSNPNDPKLIIGSTESPMTMELSNSRLSFLWNGDPVAYFSNNKLYVTNVEAIERLSVGTPANGYLDIVTTATGVGFLWRN